MTSFDVYLNGERRCTAGLEGDGVTTISIGCNRKTPHQGLMMRVLAFAGLDTPRGERIDWLLEKLAVGDEVCVRVVDAPKASRARRRRPVPPFQPDGEEIKEYFREKAKKFGWKIVEE